MSDQNIKVAICAAGELYGGVERFVSTFTEYLRDNTAIEFVVVLFYEGELARRLRSTGVDTVTVVSRWKYDPGVIARLVRLFRTRRISVVHTHGYLATILGAVAGKWSGARVVKTEHGKMEPRSRYGLRWLRMRINLFVDNLVTKALVDHVVYVTADLCKSFRAAKGRGRYSVIRNGIPPISVDADDGSLDIDRDAFNIGMVGRLSAVKGHTVTLRALLRLPERDRVKVCLFGTGPLEHELRGFCRSHGLDDSVRFMGFRSDVLEWISRFDAFVMPSLHEGLPYALLEAMYLGVPIIASRVGGLAEILEDEVDALLVEPGDECELAQAIERLMAKPDLCATLARNARTKAETQFVIEPMACQYLELYESVALEGMNPRG